MQGGEATDVATGGGAGLLTCPRCGFSIKPRDPWPAIEYCPRCLARARRAVRLLVSAPTASELDRDSTVPWRESGSSDPGQGSRSWHPMQGP